MQSTSWETLGWKKHKIARRNINNLRYADDTTLMAESEEEVKNLLTPCLFNLYAEYIMRNVGLDEAQDCQEKYQ